MKQRPRICYTEGQKALMWERWRKGESLQLAQLFDRNYSSIQRHKAALQHPAAHGSEIVIGTFMFWFSKAAVGSLGPASNIDQNSRARSNGR